MQPALKQQADNRLVHGAPFGGGRLTLRPAPGAPRDAGRCEDGGAVLGGEALRLTTPASGSLAGEALQERGGRHHGR